jgi:hypothetical protein
MERLIMTVVTSVSAIIVQDGPFIDMSLIFKLNETLAEVATDSEIIIVANNISMEDARRLKPIIDSIADSTCVVLASPTDPDIARLIGIDYAIGDYILFLTPTLSEISAIDQLAHQANDGFDIVTVVDPYVQRTFANRPLYQFLYEMYFKLYSILTGKTVRPEGVTLRLLSRAASLYVTNQFGGEILLKAREIGTGFPAVQLSIPGISEGTTRIREFKDAWRKAMRMMSSNAAPLRAALLVSFAAAILSLVYSAYVFIVYFFVAYVRGWTTLALQISGMMLLFSVIFTLLAEYVIQIHSTNPARWRRGLVMRELRSPHTKRANRINVVNQSGKFYVGAAHIQQNEQH